MSLYSLYNTLLEDLAASENRQKLPDNRWRQNVALFTLHTEKENGFHCQFHFYSYCLFHEGRNFFPTPASGQNNFFALHCGFALFFGFVVMVVFLLLLLLLHKLFRGNGSIFGSSLHFGDLTHDHLAHFVSIFLPLNHAPPPGNDC